MEERRKYKRRSTIYYIKVYNRQENRMIGRLVDISEGGMMLVNEKPVKAGEVFELRMPLPDAMKFPDEISFSARAVWCGQDINPDFYDTGFEFIDPSSETVTTIRNLFINFMS
jgi:c-di-GMP-binding flagellar brake protein YcgR